MDMRGVFTGKIAILSIVSLLFGVIGIPGAVASTPGQAMSAHLWVNGLPEGQLVTVTVAGHMQLNYVGGQGRYDFTLGGQPGETIRVLVGGRDVQSFPFDAGATVYLNFTFADGAVTASPHDPNAPMPTPYYHPDLAQEPAIERTGPGFNSSWMVVMAIICSLVVVGCYATVRRKGR